MHTIELIQPDDWHCHLRDGDYLHRTVADIATQFHRAIVMPNLSKPITNVADAKAYQQRILSHIPAGNTFKPLMTLYLTESTTPSIIEDAAASDHVYACKLYPAGATTNAQSGVADLATLYPVFETMEMTGLPLLIHGESIDPQADIFDREKLFIEQQLQPLVKKFPNLRVVLEHISTKTAVEFIEASSKNVAATITAHHLLYNRNVIFKGGIKPHYYCLPILKRHKDQQALRKAATSGNPKFFLGTDSAPHAQDKKENHCGCAGIYTAHAALAFYAEVFEQEHALDKLESFASRFGPEFYDLPVNKNKITLIKKTVHIPNNLSFGKTVLIPLRAGETVDWQIQP